MIDEKRKQIENLWEKFGFRVKSYQDLKACEILKAIKDTASEIEKIPDSSCFVCFLLGYGSMNKFYGSDFKPVNMEDILYRHFNNKQCTTLAGKPKLIFIEACEIKPPASTVNTSSTNTLTRHGDINYVHDNVSPNDHQSHEMADILFGYHLAPGRQSCTTIFTFVQCNNTQK